MDKIQAFKKEVTQYLNDQGYAGLSWDDIISIHAYSCGQPRCKLENEIDSVLTVENDDIDQFILSEIKRIQNINHF